MPAVEVWSDRGRDRVVTLTGADMVLGSDAGAAEVVLDDPTVSGVHARLERVGRYWLVRDLGSRNGTRVGGEILTGQRRLRDGDELKLGRSARLVYRDGAVAPDRRTDVLEPPPEDITRAERRVLVELCRPLLMHNTFQPPASVREIAARLFIGKNAVQFHLTNLYDKFGVYGDEGTNRRVRLANAAVDRGAVTPNDLRDDPDEGAGFDG
jgi:pSer/pThr/pTyr-binding forkhead associated (FHA) protein